MASAPAVRAAARISWTDRYARTGCPVSPIWKLWSAFSRCSELRSSHGKTATVWAPSSTAARNARTAISPRLATRTFENMALPQQGAAVAAATACGLGLCSPDGRESSAAAGPAPRLTPPRLDDTLPTRKPDHHGFALRSVHPPVAGVTQAAAQPLRTGQLALVNGETQDAIASAAA